MNPNRAFKCDCVYVMWSTSFQLCLRSTVTIQVGQEKTEHDTKSVPPEIFPPMHHHFHVPFYILDFPCYRSWSAWKRNSSQNPTRPGFPPSTGSLYTNNQYFYWIQTILFRQPGPLRLRSAQRLNKASVTALSNCSEFATKAVRHTARALSKAQYCFKHLLDTHNSYSCFQR